MAIPFLNNLDLNKFQLFNARLQNLASAPGSPVAGLVYFDTNLNSFYGYNNSTWVPLGGSVTSVGLSAPSVFTVSGSPVTSSGTLTFAFNGLSTNFLNADGSTTAHSTFQTLAANLTTVAGYSAITNLTSLTGLANPVSTSHLQITSGGVMSWDTSVYLTSSTGVSSITGTTNQITASTSTGAITLSLPQNIGTASSPTFASITISNTPSSSTDATNKAYVDNAVIGLRDYKESVDYASTSNISSLSGLLTVDGSTVVAGQRILVAGQTTASQNGIYLASASGWTRSTDFAAGANTGISLGLYVYVEFGTVNGQSGYVLSASNATSPDVSINVGTDTITFTKFSGASVYTFSTGLRTNGTTITVGSFTTSGLLIGAGAGADATILSPSSQYSVLVAGSSGVPTWGSINLASSVAVGTSILPIANGGTNASTASGARTSLGVPGKYAGTITGDGTTTSFTVTHNLGTQNVTWSLSDNSSPRITQFVEVDIPTGGNTLTFVFGAAPANALVYNITVIG